MFRSCTVLEMEIVLSLVRKPTHSKDAGTFFKAVRFVKMFVWHSVGALHLCSSRVSVLDAPMAVALENLDKKVLVAQNGEISHAPKLFN